MYDEGNELLILNSEFLAAKSLLPTRILCFHTKERKYFKFLKDKGTLALKI